MEQYLELIDYRDVPQFNTMQKELAEKDNRIKELEAQCAAIKEALKIEIIRMTMLGCSTRKYIGQAVPPSKLKEALSLSAGTEFLEKYEKMRKVLKSVKYDLLDEVNQNMVEEVLKENV